MAASWISDWNPEDTEFWESKGKFIARRNLIWSIVAEHLGFSVWLIWSIVVTKLPQAGFHFTTDQLFQLVALPGLIGSLMRFPYTFAVTKFGGRNWTIFSALVLFIPNRAGVFRDQTRHALFNDAARLGTGGTRRRQFRLEHGQYLVLLSLPHERLGAWSQRSRRQYWRQHRAIVHADPDGIEHHQPFSRYAPARRPLHSERRTDVASAASDRSVRRDLLHEQLGHSAFDLQGSACHRRP